MILTEEQAKRYSRHFALKEIGVAGQKKLLQSSVLVIGAGGLGSGALMYLAAAGVGTLGIVDSDDVELSNLQRQIIHRSGNIGVKKTRSAQLTLQDLNPDVKIITHDQRFSATNAQSIMAGYDIVLDCTDRFETKFLINDACVLYRKPYVHAGAVRFEGQVMTYLPGKGPCLRCLLGEIPSPQDALSCSQAGILGAVAGVIGDIQAIEAIKYLTGMGQLLTGRVLYFDALNMRTRVTPFEHSDPDCKVCGTHPSITSLEQNGAEYEVKMCCLKEEKS